MNQKRLFELARLCGLETEFYDGLGRFNRASVEAVTAVLRSLGMELYSDHDLDDALWLKREELTTRFVEPVIVSWSPQKVKFSVRVPLEALDETLSVQLRPEPGGEVGEVSLPARDLPRLAVHSFDGAHHAELQVCLPRPIPVGYHQVRISFRDREETASLFCAPARAYCGDEESRSWGVWAPLYALQTERSWATADFTDLEHFNRWIASLGGRFVATLPLFAAFLDDPFEPSPYAPVSRLLWNEFFVDPTRSPEWTRCPSTQATFRSEPFQARLQSLRAAPEVDYREELRLRRGILERLAAFFFRDPGSNGREALEDFLQGNPHVRPYARFRAVTERQRSAWTTWPDRLQEGRFEHRDYDQQVERYHLYSQWLAERQLSEIRRSAGREGVGMYLDLPLGVHPDGYDAWRESDTFAQDVAGGAPPDDFFSAGQDWGFQPLHPKRSRRQGHRYFREVVGRLMSFSDLIRVDHAMSLHRLFWVPRGMSAREGLYVRYPVQELMAVLVIESHRHRCVPVGEDLGTVPPVLRELMREHQLLRMYVGQFESSVDRVPPLNEVCPEVVASLNTHDTATFAGFWEGLDIDQRAELGLLDEESWALEHEKRGRLRQVLADFLGWKGGLQGRTGMMEVLRRWLRWLAASRARYVLIQLEDLWLEREPQNVPGTTDERANWRRRMRYSLEEFCNDGRVVDTLQEVDRIRREGRLDP